jgi:hypothetical protein
VGMLLMTKDKFDKIFEDLKKQSNQDKKKQEDQIKKFTNELEIQQQKKKKYSNSHTA